ncbi:MAG: hypothetical protein H5T64_06000 [Chloroflexi bacterium]|nr:hypothetical protein [Chloroflexota bacterium]
MGFSIALTLLLCPACSYHTQVDVAQGRLDSAAPSLGDGHVIGQTFTARRPNLSAIQVRLVVYGGEEVEGPITVHLRASPGDSTDLATASLDLTTYKHNVLLRFDFPPQRNSAGQRYYFALESAAPVSVWYNSWDAYGGGQLHLDGQPRDGDLEFTTYYRDDLAIMAHDLWQMSATWLTGLMAVMLVLLVPGYLLLECLPSPPDDDPLVNLALAVGLSLAVLPVGLQWLSVIGCHLSALFARLLFFVLTLFLLLRWARRGFADLRAWLALRNRRYSLAVGAVLGLTLVVRLLQVRGLVLPPWVDSVHHSLIAQLIVSEGQVPSSYEPFLPIARFYYHFGFHTQIAFTAWLSGLDVPTTILIFGQVLNAANALAVYLFATRLTGRRLAGLVAALVVGLVSWMPAYYVTWGRYTQLAGMALVPAALAQTIDATEMGGERRVVLAAVGLAGLFLTHARVAIFAAIFLGVYWVDSFLRTRRLAVGRVLAISIGAALLSLPWLVRLAETFVIALRASPQSLQGDAIYNRIPWELVWIGPNRELMFLAALGLLAALVRRQHGVVELTVTTGLVALAVNPMALGLPPTNLVNNLSAVIALYLPVSVGVGWLAVVGYDIVGRSLGRRLAQWMLALLLAIAGVTGGWRLIPIVNPVTILATADDLAAMAWIREHTPPEAVFLVNTWHWQLNIYVGSDAGYWIPILTGRRNTMPPAIYPAGDAGYVTKVNALAEAVSRADRLSEAEFRQLVRDAGATHVYVGSRGGALSPAWLIQYTWLRPIYQNGAVWIFEVISDRASFELSPQTGATCLRPVSDARSGACRLAGSYRRG